MRKIYFYEIETYPDFELCNSNSIATEYEAELNDEEFEFVTKARDDWQSARSFLFKRRRKFKASKSK